MKFLLWAAVAAIVVLWLTRGKKIAADAGSRANSASSASATATEKMMQCAHCGMHIPASESISSPSGKVFCSEDHRLRHGTS